MTTKRIFVQTAVLVAMLAACFACSAQADVIGEASVAGFSSENDGFGTKRLAAASIDSHSTYDPVVGSLDACDRGWSTDPAGTDRAPYIIYDLGGVFNLGAVRIWNWNQPPDDPFAYRGNEIKYRGQGIKAATISVAGADKVYCDVKDIIVPLAPAIDGYTGTLFTVSAKNVRYVKVSPHSNYYSDTLNETGNNAWKNQVGMAKIQFNTEPLALEEPYLRIIPTPKDCKLQAGRMIFMDKSRLVVTQADLLPVATVLAENLHRLVGLKPAVTDQSPQPGDIVLQIDPALKNEAYALEVAALATVRAGTRAALAMGTVTLLQALHKTEDVADIPRMIVYDEPAVPYRGLMIDCAREYQSPDTLKQLITLCHWYKVRYLQLHLTDDQAFTFPSKSHPELVTKSRHYTLAQLRELEQFALDRGVTLIPELDVPGHSTAFLQAMPELFGTKPTPADGWKLSMFPAICIGREDVYEALDVIVGEICEVFRASPYFHIGADEVNNRFWKECTDTHAYMAAHGIENVEELFRHFLVRMDKIVKKHGKQTIAWEGFAKEGKIQIPRDIIVQVFECKYNLPSDLLADGHQIINASWQPLYVCNADMQYMWSPQYIYAWNHYRWENYWCKESKAHGNPITVPATSQVIGAQMCAWSQPQDKQLPTLRERVAAMSERIWNPGAGRSFDDFSLRLRAADAALERLLKEK